MSTDDTEDRKYTDDRLSSRALRNGLGSGGDGSMSQMKECPEFYGNMSQSIKG